MSFCKELYFENLNDFWIYTFKDSAAKRKNSRLEENQDWYGGVSWEEAKILAKNGWKEGMEALDKYRATYFPAINEKVLRPSQIYSVVGYQVDVGSYLANQPEHFINHNFEERNYPGRIFKLVSSVSVSAKIEPQTIIQRGAMICALVDAIEFAGHRVEVICNDAASYAETEEARMGLNKERGWFEVSVCVKKPDQPLEMTDLAFCLAHPAMLRRIMFSAAELEGWSDYTNNYGYPATATVKGDLYLQELFSGTVSDDTAIEWVMEQLKILNIDMEIR
ncbi:MAG: hypothetical protein RIA69_04570 [Cyclobacteriaceae bacterium]